MIDLFRDALAPAGPLALDGVSTLATLTGTAGDDSLVGSAGEDVFHMEQGGDDTVHGGAEDDSFYFGASFTAKDHIYGDSGHGHDTLYLDGDYSAGVTLAGNTLTRIDQIVLAAGHSYAFDTGTYANFSFGISGAALGAGESLHVDTSQSTFTHLGLVGGAGDDVLIGRGQYVALDGGEGNNTLTSVGDGATSVRAGDGVNTVLTGANSDVIIMSSIGLDDRIDAGSRSDQDRLYLGTHGSDLSFDAVKNIEQIYLEGGEVKVENGFGGTRKVHNTLTFWSDEHAISLRFDASAEHRDSLIVYGSDQSDTITGGDGNDHLYGEGGTNTLIGGGGQDTLTGSQMHDKLVGGSGADILVGDGASDSFVYLAYTDSTDGSVDEITDLAQVDIVDLKAIDADTKKAGNQAFHLVDDFTHHRGELMLSYDADTGRTSILGDIDGNGVADLVISADGKHVDFTNFVL